MNVDSLGPRATPPAVLATTTSVPGTASTTTAVPNPVATTSDGSGVGVGIVILIAALAGLVAFAAGRFIRPSTPSGPTPATAQKAPEPATVVLDSRAAEQRERLVEAIIDARDRSESRAVNHRLGKALEDVGIETIDPTGQPFDVEQHAAQPPPLVTTDPALDGTVAEVLSYGYREAGKIRRLPVVVVHLLDRSIQT